MLLELLDENFLIFALWLLGLKTGGERHCISQVGGEDHLA